MLTLYSYPELFGVADNNGYGLKVYAFLKLTGVPFIHRHVFDASAAPRGQLPYIVDDEETIGDSGTIVAHLIRKYRLTIDDGLTDAQRDTSHLITRMLDDLYWVMSYSRWKDEQYWPLFRDALIGQHHSLTEDDLGKARAFNSQRYHYQGIGRFAPADAYARGLTDLEGTGESFRWKRIRARSETDQHRRRHLRLHRQYLFLSDRNAAEAVRRRAGRSRPPLLRDPRCHWTFRLCGLALSSLFPAALTLRTLEVCP
jgi:glutathione S-transferase